MRICKWAAFSLALVTLLSALSSCDLLGPAETTGTPSGTRPTVTSPQPETIAPPLTGDETDPPEDTTLPPETESAAPDTTIVTEKVTEQETTAKVTTQAETTEEYANELGFKTNLSAYEKYMDPQDRDAYIVLVNPSHPVDKNYKPDDLEPLVDTRSDRSKRYMRYYAAKSLEAFLKEARANGCKDVTVTSAFRSYESQKEIFDGDVENLMKKGYSREEAIAIERQDTAYPGESEHQTGLAVDMHNLSSAQLRFKDTYEAQWLAENCWKFGFILRYMPGKEDITTYTYEPWHFRFVGRYHAKRIYDMGMCLEEYIEYLENN